MHAVSEVWKQTEKKKKQTNNLGLLQATAALTDEAGEAGMSRDKGSPARWRGAWVWRVQQPERADAAQDGDTEHDDAKAVVAGLVGGAASRVRRPVYLGHHHHVFAWIVWTGICSSLHGPNM
jgi:hypothetical protein